MNKMLKFECPDFKANINKNIKRAIIISVIVALFLGLFSRLWIYSIAVGCFIFCVYVIKAFRWNRFYIKEILINSEVLIKYLDKGTERVVQGDKNDFVFKKRMGISTAKIPSLFISKNSENITIIQYEIGEWDENKMDELLSSLNTPDKMVVRNC